MILIIDSDDNWIKQYIAYVKAHNISHVIIDLKTLISQTAIYDKFSSLADDCIWVSADKIIDFKKVTGIFHRCNFFINDALLENYQTIDQHYARNEWLAYFIYRFSKHRNCINPVRSYNTSLDYITYLLMFNKAKACGFDVPQFYLSSDPDQLRKLCIGKQYFFRKNIYDYNDFLLDDFTEDSVCAIEYIFGSPVYVYTIGNTMVSYIRYREGKELFELPDTIANSCRAIVDMFQLKVAEVYLHRTLDNRYYFYYLTFFPDWSHMDIVENDLWGKLTNELLSHPIKHTQKELRSDVFPLEPLINHSMKKSFISPELRPRVLASYIKTTTNKQEPRCNYSIEQLNPAFSN